MSQIHFEVFARRARAHGFTLELATEDRKAAVEAAEELMASGRAAQVKVTKETLDTGTSEFRSITIMTRGEEMILRRRTVHEDTGPLCVAPPDLYTHHARDRIGHLLEAWLTRHRATPFELLHRPDLVEQLEAAGAELQHAIQKVAVPEAQARSMTTHDAMRHFSGLAERAMERVLTDAKKGRLPDLNRESFETVCRRYAEDAESNYLVGCAVAGHLAAWPRWSCKIDRLLDLADAAPLAEGPARALALSVVEEPLGEILGSRLGLADLLGPDLDHGASLLALARLASGKTLEPLIAMDATLGRLMPQLTGPAARLADWFHKGAFESVRTAIGKRILKEVVGQRRLRPDDPSGEIEVLRSLAMALTATAGRLMPLDDVREAFVQRSRALAGADFVETLLKDPRPALQEARDLVRLLENVTGIVNKRAAVRFVSGLIASLRFETELMAGPETPAQRLQALADLHRLVGRAAAEVGAEEMQHRISDIAGRIEAGAKLTASLAKAPAPLHQRLSALLGLALGETAPAGPVADRAKAEALKLVRVQGALQELSEHPEVLGRMRQVVQAGEAAA